MAFTYAGQWGPEAIVAGGAGHAANLVSATTQVTVYLTDHSTQASLYTDASKATSATNPVTVDTAGNLTIFADPGAYILQWTVSGATSSDTIVVPVNPLEISGIVSSQTNRVLGSTDPTSRPTAAGVFVLWNTTSDPGTHAVDGDLAVGDGW